MSGLTQSIIFELVEKHKLTYSKPFLTESGFTFPGLELTYHTYGRLDPERNNVIWICHAFTANSDASDWWPGLVGENAYFNPDDHFVVCVNMLGSCYGTTGPLDINPLTGKPYFSTFPVITIRDIVRTMQIVKDHLGIQKIRFALGYSMGA